MRQPALAWLWDNIEAFAVAIAMALVIRHYSVEAFRIPTASMMPTLRGDDKYRGLGGDRILVDKTCWEWREPRRFEVAVFRYPLNTNKNFIKRIGGLPGEWMRLVDGDIWTSVDKGKRWTIARKPAGARESLFFPYWPWPVDARDKFEGVTCWECTGSCAATGEDSFAFSPGGEGGAMLFLMRVSSYNGDELDASPRRRDQGNDGGYGGIAVGDVRLSFTLDVKQAGTLEVHLVEHGNTHRLVLGAESSFAEIGGPEPHRIPLETVLEAGRKIDVSFANVDDTLVVELPRDGMVEIPFPDPPSEPPTAVAGVMRPDWGLHEISVKAQALVAGLSRVRLDRDVCYDAGQNRGLRTDYDGSGESDLRRGEGGDTADGEVGEWRIPEDCYFMLGDNTLNSSDSRAWNVSQARLSDGTILEWVPGPVEEGDRRPEMDNGTEGVRWREGPDGEIRRFAADVDGLVRYFPFSKVEERRSGIPKHFVPADHLVGRAFAVFWPIHLPPVSRGPTRVKLIR